MNSGGTYKLALLALIALICNTKAIGIDDKLDFGDGRKIHTALRNENIYHRSSVLPVQHSYDITKIGNSDDLSKIEVVCTTGGCNTTNSTTNTSVGDTIKTDVVVHIETKIDLNQTSSSTTPADDTPDIPIVIGSDDSNSNNFDGIRSEPKSIFIPSNEPHYFQNSRPHVQGSNFINSRGSIYPIQSNRRTHPISYPDMLNLNPEVDISIKSLPPIAIGINRDMNSYKSNVIEMSVPYFDQMLHNHYYGENPPPQYAFYPKEVRIMNPVEFNVMRPRWKPSQWQGQYNNYHTHSVMPIGKAGECNCDKRDGRTDGHWYPNPNLNRRSSVTQAINDPGSQINDKLAPLN